MSALAPAEPNCYLRSRVVGQLSGHDGFYRLRGGLCAIIFGGNLNVNMDADTFCGLVLSEFPSLRQDFEEWEGLLHLQVGEFLRWTQEAIEAQSFEVVSKCFYLANVALVSGDNELRNAIYVSYLEQLDLRSQAGKRAAQLMPAELRQGRDDILDYCERLLGRKLLVDDR